MSYTLVSRRKSSGVVAVETITRLAFAAEVVAALENEGREFIRLERDAVPVPPTILEPDEEVEEEGSVAEAMRDAAREERASEEEWSRGLLGSDPS